MILVDGVQTGSIPVTDSIVLRGDGVFEALRTDDGVPFALAEHLDRLDRSIAAMELPAVDRTRLEAWIWAAAEPDGEAMIRVLVSRGDASVLGRVVVMSVPVPRLQDPFTVTAHPAPWHPGGRRWELAGVKTLSYAPNLAASRAAGAKGYGDALLITDDDVVLEGPTFCVGWLRDGRFETPSLDLGILASVTRAQTIGLLTEMEVEVVEGRFELDTLDDVTDLIAMSTVKRVTSIARCDEIEPPITDLTAELARRFGSLAPDSTNAGSTRVPSAERR